MLYTFVGLCYVEWAALLSMIASFYPLEAEAKGAQPSEVSVEPNIYAKSQKQTIVVFHQLELTNLLIGITKAIF